MQECFTILDLGTATEVVLLKAFFSPLGTLEFWVWNTAAVLKVRKQFSFLPAV